MKYLNITNATKKAYNKSITFNELVCKRFYHVTKGHSKLHIEDVDLRGLRDLIGGRGYNYLRLLKDHIAYGSSYGILERLIFDGKRWSYCAGQDYVAEMNTLRKILREG